MNDSKTGTSADRPHPSVRGTSIESLSVASAQNRSFMEFADCQVDRSGCPRNKWNDRGLVAFAEDSERAVTALERKAFDIGRARFGDP
jgi:hypothetical protein